MVTNKKEMKRKWHEYFVGLMNMLNDIVEDVKMFCIWQYAKQESQGKWFSEKRRDSENHA